MPVELDCGQTVTQTRQKSRNINKNVAGRNTVMSWEDIGIRVFDPEGRPIYLSQPSRRTFCPGVGSGRRLIRKLGLDLVPNTSSVSPTEPLLV